MTMTSFNSIQTPFAPFVQLCNRQKMYNSNLKLTKSQYDKTEMNTELSIVKKL
jgi:hypothetical protein